jgi:APA family basic amino acid/polyamine antiporter
MAGIPIVFNLPAVAIVALVTWVLVIGVKESSKFNARWCVEGPDPHLLHRRGLYVKPAGTPSRAFGVGHQLRRQRSSSPHIGFDAVSTAAEVPQSQRDMPIGLVPRHLLGAVRGDGPSS